ncbi:MAG: hypothetical protein ACHP79_18295, partial [Terriglobales bacterium]
MLISTLVELPTTWDFGVMLDGLALGAWAPRDETVKLPPEHRELPLLLLPPPFTWRPGELTPCGLRVIPGPSWSSRSVSLHAPSRPPAPGTGVGDGVGVGVGAGGVVTEITTWSMRVG